MQPLILITVGYIIGIVWGLYLNISIVPIAFLFIGGILLLNLDSVKKYKYIIVIMGVFAIISNMQITYLENKFDNLYAQVNTINAIGVVISDGDVGNYKTSYTIKIEQVNGKTEFKNTRLIVYVSNNKVLEYGTKISFTRRI